MLFMASAGVYGQVTVMPSVSVSETLTDNVRLASDGQQSEQITEISAGVRINIDGATLKTFFDYSLTSVMYAQNSSPDSTQFQNGLNTFGTLEVVDGWAFVDFNGSISQQAVSAFGTQSVDNAAINANKAEVAHYRLSPYVRGRLGDMASYEARYSRSVTNSDTAEGSGVSMVDGSVRLSGASAFRNLGWSADGNRQTVNYSAGRPTENDRLSLGLSYSITPQLRIFSNAGRESNNYTSIEKKSYGTSGFGASWFPSELTSLSASRDHRSFGEAHNLSFSHRTARTMWRFTDSKDVSATPSQTGIASLGSIYDLLYSQFESLEPNPTARARLVNAYLQANGISPNAIVVSSFLTAAVSLQRRQDFSLALLGVRDTVTFIATRSEGSRLDTVSTGVDDFSNSSLVRQRGFMVNYAHRLTPDYSLGVLVSQQNTSGVSSQQDITLRSFNINVTGRVGRKATASIAVRRVVSSGNTSSYIETAVIGSLIVQF
ncbi:TIGR03016 family PEP-CTERM system-associated outer membrane protein [Rhodoferax ferrireducens]|uniref:TIGR03016 family PEP-CTERM system-associated outer membrane protein n=1 Tax=Rhodoferax ferrireducens TaxID=192843 RepID=UPI00130036E5|nr:TIGR03016 family PEP-CTERM system-associated outer membrane protein [Rhodoferax ferrireducens]